jgi:hypothetical protein
MFYTILMPFYALSLGFDAAEELSARFRVATVLPGALTLEIPQAGSPNTATGFVPFSVNLTTPDHLIHPEAGN